MKTFLAVYMGSSSPAAMEKWKSMTDADRKEKEALGMKEWMNWGEKHSKSIVDDGTPLGRTKRVSKNGIEDIKNLMTAYTLIQAGSHEEAAKMFMNHPHFSVFPGDSVEIMECLSLPKM